MSLILRPTTIADRAAVDALLALSYPRLLAPDYPVEVLDAVLPGITRSKPELLESGTYHVLESDGLVVAAGGWTAGNPAKRGTVTAGQAHVRHVVSHPDHLRRGHARMLMTEVMRQARMAGNRQIECLSTRTAVPFYAALGFAKLADVDVVLASGLTLPSVRMARPL